MGDPRDERAPSDGQHEDWLTDLAGPDRPVRPGIARGGLRDRGGGLRSGGLRQRPAPTPTLDSARVRSARSIVAPKRAEQAEDAEPAEEAEEEPAATRKAGPALRRTPSGASARKPAPAVPQVKMPALPKVNLPSVKVSAEDIRKLAARRPKLHRPALHRPHWRLSARHTAALGIGLAALLATVGGLATVVPNKPVVDPGSGAVNNVEFTAAGAPPDTIFNFGPFFVPTEGRLLMMGSDGQTSFVWASTDGSNWERYTSVDAFGGPDHRFVVLGFAADGNGGYVTVGDSFDADGNVSASAWYSRDAKRWFAASIDFPENAEMMGLAVGSEAMVSAGNGVAWISRGGTSWKMVALPDATGYVPRAVRTWAGGYAIVSAWAGDGDRKSAVWVSPDGETWLQGWSMLTLFDVEDAVAYGSGLVAVGSQGRTVDELATPTPKATPEPSASAKVTPKATKTPEPTPDTSGSPGASMEPTPTPLPTTAAIAYQIAGSWSSANGLEWFKGNSLGGPYAQSMTSVAQAFDSLVAVGSSPGDLRGTDSAGEGNLTLWVTDDGNAWKPIRTNVPTLSRSRIVQYGRYLVLAGVGPSGRLTVLTGEVSLGAPLPPVFASPTPAIALSVQADESPAVPGLKGVDTLGPVVAVGDRFYFFINQEAGTGIWTSTDGRSPLVAQAEPADLLPEEGAEGSTPTVLDAIADGNGGILAVGKITADGEDKAAIWRLSGETWTQVPITGSAPAALGSLAQYDGTFVAAATVAEGPRIMVSEDGGSWVEASVPGSSGYLLRITSWSGGFVASGSTGGAAAEDEEDSDAEPSATPGTVHVWTSPDGLVWTAQADWLLPRNPGQVIGAGDGLVITSTGITGKDSWWWSADGKAWQEAQLTTAAGGCMARLDTGLIKVAPPAPEAEDPAWHVWVSEDGKSWQNPGIDNVAFEDTTVCRVASSGKKIMIVGWASPSVLRVYVSR